MTFCSTKRVSATTLADSQTNRNWRAWRLSLVLTLVTVLLGLWLFWRYGAGAVTIAALPETLVEIMSLLTYAAIGTVGLLWAIAAYQRYRAKTIGQGSIVDVVQLQTLSPAEFERFAARLFRAHGYQVEVRGRSGDLGVDLEITNERGKRAIAQCKRYRSTVGPDVVRELYGTMIHERVAHAFLVTTADISPSAREWAAGKPLTLIDGATLFRLANEAQLMMN